MTTFAEWNYIKFEFFFIAAMMVIVCGWFIAFRTFQGERAWHSTALDFIMNSISRAALLWFTFAIIFGVLFDVFAIILLVFSMILCALFLAAFIAFLFAAAIFRPKAFPTFALRFGMTTKPIFALANLFQTRVTRSTQAFGLMFPFALASFTDNHYPHTMIIV